MVQNRTLMIIEVKINVENLDAVIFESFFIG